MSRVNIVTSHGGGGGGGGRMGAVFTTTLLVLLASIITTPSHALSLPRTSTTTNSSSSASDRERTSLNQNWRFHRWETNPDGLTYDNRSDQVNITNLQILKPWILPHANEFIPNPSNWYQAPAALPPGGNVSFLQPDFDDSAWATVTLPHDWAIAGPFYTDPDDPVVSGSMGRLPSQGVGWYRRNLSWTQDEADAGRLAYLDIDGAMSYALVWLNGQLVGGWPYPYNSFRLDLTPYLKDGDDNLLAIRLDNPNESSRWYPGGGIYRNVWLTKTEPVHVGHYGTFITTSDVSSDSATVQISVNVDNRGQLASTVEVQTTIYEYDNTTKAAGTQVAEFPATTLDLPANGTQSLNSSTVVQTPKLWFPGPAAAQPNLYLATTRLYVNGTQVDTYTTRFGIRSVEYNPDQGLLINGEHVLIQGVNQHHDLGALGAAFNVRAAQRRFELLQEMGGNAMRMSHNPPAPELLDLADEMGFLVLDEIFDCWQLGKVANDFHLIFDDWHEADLRNMARRDRNHASVVLWSYGNEVGEQQTGDAGAAINAELRDILDEEDPTRLKSASQNSATPNLPWSQVVEGFYLNYQGAGIRDIIPYSNLTGIRLPPMYPEYKGNFSDKMMLSSESAAAVDSRGVYFFPVTEYVSAPVNDTDGGGNSTEQLINAYALYTDNFGSSPDKVFGSQDENPYAAGEFVWAGLDYLGEPSPYNSRSSYYGILDIAGFRKDRFYLYQSRWNADVQVAHIVPHWTWPERIGLVTPVHVFSAADTAELFLNGTSLGTKTRAEGEYRFRWDDVVYQPGELSVVTYKNNQTWANASVKTAGSPAKLQLTVDRAQISADGLDLAFVTATVVDASGNVVPRANDAITFSVDGPGEVVATDNGDQTDYTVFPSPQRDAFNGLALAIVRATAGDPGSLTISATADGLGPGTVAVVST